MAFRSASTTTFASGVGDVLTATAPAGVQAGDRLLAFIAQDLAGGAHTAATGWDTTPLATLGQASPDGQTVTVFEKKNASGSDSYNFTGSYTLTAIVVVMAFSGRDNTAAATVSTPTIDTAGNATPVSMAISGLTAAAGDDIAWLGQLDETAGTSTWSFTGPGGYTERADSTTDDWVSAAAYTLDGASAGATGTLTGTGTRLTGSADAGFGGVIVALPAASGGGTSLVVQDMAHAVSIDNMVLTSSTALTVADSAHALAIDNVVLTSQTALAVADSAHALAIDNLTLSTTNSTSLAVADSTHALAIDNVALTTQTVLAIAEMLHGMVMDNIALTSSTALTIAEMNHGVAIDNVTLSTLTGTTLVVADLLHALSIDNMALTSQTALAIADLLHGLSIDGVTLTTASVLAVADMLHAVAMDNMTLVAFNGTTLAIADALHAVAIDNTTLGIGSIALVIADVMHGVAIDNMVLTSATALLIADLLHNHTIDNIVLFIPGGGYSTLDLIFKILTNRQELNPANGTFTLYDDDSTTVLYTAAAWADTAGTVPYSGGKLQRIDALQ